MNIPSNDNSIEFIATIRKSREAFSSPLDELRQHLAKNRREVVLTEAERVPHHINYNECFSKGTIETVAEAMVVLENPESTRLALLEAKIAVVQWGAYVKEGFFNDRSIPNWMKMRSLLTTPRFLESLELQIHWNEIMSGLLTEIVAYKVCLEGNLQPRFATPIEDIQLKADFWVGDAPIQVKKLPQAPFDVHVAMNTIIGTTVNRVATFMQSNGISKVTPKMLTQSLHNDIELIVPYLDLLPSRDYKDVRKLLLNFYAYKRIREDFPDMHHILINTHDKNIIGQDKQNPSGELSREFINAASKKMLNALAIRRVSKRNVR